MERWTRQSYKDNKDESRVSIHRREDGNKLFLYYLFILNIISAKQGRFTQTDAIFP